ncbi:acyl-CoA thioesterase [Brumimicrobium glaciale]|jgi:acyl-CoA thioester hydrolase|uniref:Acyl-CoA thioesterase n=1 Tax=Brumimicrobium glaciale TaxID=200475 RepID=A0A4Q4KPJ2_9FLAO|nr:thioesterase family protein [Brumimicrobium glaciale]RYM34767.1 acyl-CoA thioesterase [Brumimicrobium glaciale]
MSKNNDCLHSAITQLRVRYGETDQMGYCYYGNYAQYFEVGRVEAMRDLGMSYKDIENKGFMLPVSTFSVKYIAPALYDDLLSITTKIVDLNGVRLYFEYEVKNEENRLLATAETVLVFVDKKTMRPVLPPDDFVKLLHSKKSKKDV